MIGGCSDNTTTTRMSPGTEPPAISEAAHEAVDGEITGVVKEEEDSEVIYEVQMLGVDGKKYEVEVTADGTVLEVEEGDDD